MENERAWGRADQTGGHDDTLRAATEECNGRRAPASPEQLEEEERDNAYDKAGFLSFKVLAVAPAPACQAQPFLARWPLMRSGPLSQVIRGTMITSLSKAVVLSTDVVAEG